MIIHVFTVCYNEEVLLPHFLKHYGSFAERITVYDNESTDGSARIIDACPKAKRVVFSTGDKVLEPSLMEIRNEKYKESRGQADWVMVVDVDEFLYHPELVQLLARYQEKRITLPKVKGFEMVSPEPPKSEDDIFSIKAGVANRLFDKRVVFHPAINVNYLPGCHSANPAIDVHYALSCHSANPAHSFFSTVYPFFPIVESAAEIKLLHYRFLGRNHFIERSLSRRKRMSQENIRNKWSVHYMKSETEFGELYDRMAQQAQAVI